MKRRHTTYLLILNGLWLCLGCQSSAESTRTHKADFDRDLLFAPAFLESLPRLTADSVMRRMKNETPPKWGGAVCESLYYHLPDNLSDSVVFRYLDLFEAYFPQDTVRAFAQMQRGVWFTRKIQYDTALICLTDALNINQRAGQILRVADVKRILGSLHFHRTDYTACFKELFEAYHIFSQDTTNGNDLSRRLELATDISIIYGNIKDFKEAKKWCTTAWGLANRDTVFNAYKIITAARFSLVYWRLGQIDSSSLMINSAFDLQKKYNNNSYAGQCYWILANIERSKGQCAAAIAHHYEVFRTETDRSVTYISRNQRGLGEAYLCLGKLDSALHYLTLSLATPDSVMQMTTHNLISQIWGRKGNFEQSFFHQRAADALQTRVLANEKLKAIGLLEGKYSLEKRVLELGNQEKEQRIRQLWLLNALILLSALLVGSLLWITRQRQRQKLLNQEGELLAVRARLQAQTLETTQANLEQKSADLIASEKLVALKNQIIAELETKTQQFEREIEASSTNAHVLTEELQHLKILTNADWQRFRRLFDEALPDYNDRIQRSFPQLTAAEQRLFLLYKLGFDKVKIVNALGISLDSVYKSRYRLKKKLALREEADLEIFIQGF